MTDETEETDNWTGAWCPQCGFDPSVDEDGLCNHCGCVAIGNGVEDALALRVECGELRKQLREAVDALYPLASACVTQGTGFMVGGEYGAPYNRREVEKIVARAIEIRKRHLGDRCWEPPTPERDAP